MKITFFLGLRFLIVFLFCFSLMQNKAYAAIDPKAQVIITMATYGSVGGALLGGASLAYGTSFRAVAVGASLGLYAGLLFGGYLIGSHYFMRRGGQDRAVPDEEAGYEEEESVQEESIFLREPAPYAARKATGWGKKFAEKPLFYFNFFLYQF